MVGNQKTLKFLKGGRHYRKIFVKALCSSFPLKSLAGEQHVALALYLQGETGLRGEIGNPGRDGARVSRISV